MPRSSADASGSGRTPEISVVIPTHNRWSLLEPTLRAVLSQEDVELEIIVVDDGSADETPARLDAYDDPRLRVHRHETAQGVARARNAGIALARAPWTAFTDDDDLWAPRKLRTQLDALEQAQATWSYGAGLIVDRDWRVIDVFRPPAPDRIASELARANAVPGGCSDVMARTLSVRAIGGFDPQFSVLADYDFFLRLSRTGPAAMYPGRLMAYVQHPMSMSLADVDSVADEFARLRAKHAAAGVYLRVAPLWRWIAYGLYQRGRRREAARLYLATAARHGDVLSVARALLVLSGRRLTEVALRHRRSALGTTPAWLCALTGRAAGDTTHIGLSAVFLSERSAGVGTYAWRLAAALAELRPTWRFTLFTGGPVTPPAPLPANVTLISAPVPVRRWAARAVWEQVGLWRQSERAQVDLLHSLNGSGPARLRVPHVVTIHDLIFEHAPADYSPGRRAIISAIFRRTACAVDRVLTVSRGPAEEIATAYGVDRARIRVVYNGPGTEPVPARPADRSAFRARHGLAPGVPLILTVGSAHHYKNLDGAVRALAALRARGTRAEWCVVGSLGDLEGELRRLADELESPMRWHGWATADELEAAYAEATVVALPSVAEGFGLPLLESFSRRRPVVASHIDAFAEVGGDAVVLADSRDAAAFADAIAALLADPDRRAALVTAGARRLADFSWEATARATATVYDELLEADVRPARR